MDFLNKILDANASDLISSVVEKTGLDADQARSFVPEAASSIFDTIKRGAGDLDLSQAMSNPRGLIEKIDLSALAAKVGIDREQASSGLAAIVPDLLRSFKEKAGGFEAIGSMTGGLKRDIGDAVGGLGGKLFGK